MVALVLVLQSWTVTPARPTVGDTVWLERVIPTPAGWQVRPGRLGPARALEPLADPSATRVAGGWLVRYPVVTWTPGRHTVTFPAVWRLAADGSADSLDGGSFAFAAVSVIPDSLFTPAPRPAAAPLRPARRSPLPVAGAGAAVGLLLVVGVRWRRRPQRRAVDVPPPAARAPVADARWLAAGEPKAVAARAAAELRAALARAVPEASVGRSLGECLTVLEAASLRVPLGDVTEVLRGLEQVEFAAVHDADVAALASRARDLAEAVAP